MANNTFIQPSIEGGSEGEVKSGDAEEQKSPADKAEEAVMPRRNYAVPIVFCDDDDSFHFDENALRSVLLRKGIEDMNVVVVSVAGPLRKGKSFLLNFFLRYLRANDTPNWLGNTDEPLEGFSWKGGIERDTRGVLLWSEPFIRSLPNGEHVAILLVDTQGAFDPSISTKDYITIFSLTAMISSMQIYNVFHNIQDDDLKHLLFFINYGRLVHENNSSNKPFQNLMFLVRDWPFPYDIPFGAEGGKQLLDRRSHGSGDQMTEVQSVMRNINGCFENISCFLMPHPGLKAATDREFKGSLDEMDAEFVRYLKLLVPSVLSPSNLVAKEVAGRMIKAKELLYFFESYAPVLRQGTHQQPQCWLNATTEASNFAAAGAAKAEYKRRMDMVYGGTRPFATPAALQEEHSRNKREALQIFDSTKKFGGDYDFEVYKDELSCEIDQMFQQYKEYNEGKNIFKAIRSPIVVVFAMLLINLISDIFNLLYLNFLDIFCQSLLVFGAIILAAWSYVRFTGQMVELGDIIDEMAMITLDKIINFMKKEVEQQRLLKVANTGYQKLKNCLKRKQM